jgi:hypothetical protein
MAASAQGPAAAKPGYRLMPSVAVAQPPNSYPVTSSGNLLRLGAVSDKIKSWLHYFFRQVTRLIRILMAATES